MTLKDFLRFGLVSVGISVSDLLISESDWFKIWIILECNLLEFWSLKFHSEGSLWVKVEVCETEYKTSLRDF